MEDYLQINTNHIRTSYSGRFISRGVGIHETRVTDTYEIIFVSSGTLYLFEEDRKYAVPKNHALILCPFVQHGGYMPYDPDLSFYWHHFYPADSEKDADIIRIPKFTRVGRPDRLLEELRSFLDDRAGGRDNPRYDNLITKMLLHEIADFAGITETERTKQILASRVKTYIRTHYSDDLSTSRISRALGYNPDYLERMYKSYFGTTISRDITDERIKQACFLLLNSDFNISEISDLCGFTRVEYFFRVFKNSKGVSPKSYRNGFGQFNMNTL
ncbi:MAG: AraC family transcriptional regulator [Candidatus Howiella sp.]|jgi:AraC-like DNA-binding protein